MNFTNLWHWRLGHVGEKTLKVLQKQKLLPGFCDQSLDFCEHCVYGKVHRAPFGVGKHTSRFILEYIHSDVWGKAPTPSHSGKEYYVSFVDDYSRFA